MMMLRSFAMSLPLKAVPFKPFKGEHCNQSCSTILYVIESYVMTFVRRNVENL